MWVIGFSTITLLVHSGHVPTPTAGPGCIRTGTATTPRTFSFYYHTNTDILRVHPATLSDTTLRTLKVFALHILLAFVPVEQLPIMIIILQRRSTTPIPAFFSLL